MKSALIIALYQVIAISSHASILGVKCRNIAEWNKPGKQLSQFNLDQAIQTKGKLYDPIIKTKQTVALDPNQKEKLEIDTKTYLVDVEGMPTLEVTKVQLMEAPNIHTTARFRETEDRLILDILETKKEGYSQFLIKELTEGTDLKEITANIYSTDSRNPYPIFDAINELDTIRDTIIAKKQLPYQLTIADRNQLRKVILDGIVNTPAYQVRAANGFTEIGTVLVNLTFDSNMPYISFVVKKPSKANQRVSKRTEIAIITAQTNGPYLVHTLHPNGIFEPIPDRKVEEFYKENFYIPEFE